MTILLLENKKGNNYTRVWKEEKQRVTVHTTIRVSILYRRQLCVCLDCVNNNNNNNETVVEGFNTLQYRRVRTEFSNAFHFRVIIIVVKETRTTRADTFSNVRGTPRNKIGEYLLRNSTIAGS